MKAGCQAIPTMHCVTITPPHENYYFKPTFTKGTSQSHDSEYINSVFYLKHPSNSGGEKSPKDTVKNTDNLILTPSPARYCGGTPVVGAGRKLSTPAAAAGAKAIVLTSCRIRQPSKQKDCGGSRQERVA